MKTLNKKSEQKVRKNWYCNNCARKITITEIGSTVIAADGVWCKHLDCMKAAKEWQRKFIAQNLDPALEALSKCQQSQP